MAIALALPAMAIQLTSPNGNLVLNVELNAEGTPVYQLSYKGKTVVMPSRLGLELKNEEGLTDGFVLKNSSTSTFDETW